MRSRVLLPLLVSLVSLVLPRGAAAQDTFAGVPRIVAVGDVHGDFGQFVTVLRQAGVIDAKNRWIGGRTNLVQAGDVPDRGPDSRKVMDLLMKLEPQAQRAGGRVHALIGNHEAMNVLGDLRYVTPEEYQAFRTPESETLRNRSFAALADSTQKGDTAYRRQWEADHPLGWVEHRLAFESTGRYGAWIRRHNAVIRIGDYLFLHGGIGPKYVAQSLSDINSHVRQDLDVSGPRSEPGIAADSEGPLWYRGLATGDEAAMAAHVDRVLTNFGVQHIVIGHTVTAGTVMTRNDGKVIMIDVGLSAAYGGPPACLVIKNRTPYTLHRGRKLTLPLGGDPLPYLRAAAKLDPQPSRLQKLIDQLEGAPAGAGATPHPAGVPWNRATQLARGPMQPSFASKLTGLVFALGSADTLTAQSSPVERELLRLEDNWCLAPRTRDETLLNGILAEDHVEVTGSGRITSRAEAIASLKDPKSPTTWCANSNVKARVYGVPFSGKRLVFTDTSGRQTATWS